MATCPPLRLGNELERAKTDVEVTMTLHCFYLYSYYSDIIYDSVIIYTPIYVQITMYIHFVNKININVYTWSQSHTYFF